MGLEREATEKEEAPREASVPVAGPATVPAPVPVSRGLWNRDFTLLWGGQTVSQLGNQAFSVAMAFWLVEATGSASLMGLLLTASTLPGVVLGPLGGAVADRFSRIRIAVVSDVIGGLAMTALALYMLSGRAATSTVVALLFVVGVLMGIVRAFFGPAIGAALPDLVPRERVAAANSISQFTLQGSLLLGQGVGGVLYGWLGAPLLFLVDGVTYLFAAGSEALVRLPPTRRPVAAISGGPGGPGTPETPEITAGGPGESVAAGGPGSPGLATVFRGFWADIKEGFAYVKATRGLLGFFLAASCFNFFIMPVFVLLPFYVTDFLGRGARWYGFLLAAISAGQIVGFLAAGVIPLAGRAKANFIIWLMVLAPTPLALISLIRSTPAVLAFAFVLGVALGMINVHVITILQVSTPNEMRGRVMGLMGTLVGAVIPLGMALGGIVGDLTGKNVPLIYTVCGLASFLFTLLTLHRSDTREFLAGG